MDKLWDRKSFEVIGRCGGDEKTRMTTQKRQNLNAKNHHPYDIAVRVADSLLESLRRSYVGCKSFSITYVTSRIICVCLINVTGELGLLCATTLTKTLHFYIL